MSSTVLSRAREGTGRKKRKGINDQRFDYHTLVLLYRIREKLAPDHLFSLLPSLISSTSGYSLRKHSYPVPFTKKSATLNSFLPRAIILWNTLPFGVQSCKSLGMFKSKLKTHLSRVVSLLHTFSHQPPSSTPLPSTLLPPPIQSSTHRSAT